MPTTFTSCQPACPPNAFFTGSEPWFISGIIRPVREVVTATVFGSIAVLLLARLLAATRNLRRTLAPVVMAALLGLGSACFYVILRRIGVDPDINQTVRLIALTAAPLTALGFLIGLLQWRIYSAGALMKLTTGLVDPPGPAGTRTLLAASLAEPAVELRYAPPGEEWRVARGAGSAAPAPAGRGGTGRAEAESGLRVIVICPPAFADYPEFMGAIASCVVAGLERRRLDVALNDSVTEITASRKRLARTAFEARHAIERDLHDGAQQRLVALRVRLELARDAEVSGTAETGSLLTELSEEVDEIIAEVRALAHGIYPPLLASRGIGEALRAAGRRSPLPVTVLGDGATRHPMEIESAVYFCCLEALQNAAKHASGATGITVTLRDRPELGFEVSDDGCGFRDEATAGSGITGMEDRLAAVGGTLEIESARGRGTQVRGRLASPGDGAA